MNAPTKSIPQEGCYLVLIPKKVMTIAPGSGIVAAQKEGMFHIHYEGNLYGAENLRTWEERLLHAAGRAYQNYPTTARMAMPESVALDHFLVVGKLDYQRVREELKNRAATFLSTSECVLQGLEIDPSKEAEVETWAELEP